MCLCKIKAIIEHDWEKIGSAVSKHSANFMCNVNGVNEYSNMFGHCVVHSVCSYCVESLQRMNARKGLCWPMGQCWNDEDINLGLGIGANLVLFS